jgi:hypothetical protein
MKKKVAFQLGVIAVSVLLLVLMSIPLFKKDAGDEKQPLTPQAALGRSSKPGPERQDSSVQTIKLRSVKDDKFYERLSRVAEALPMDRDPFSFVFTGPKSLRDGLELTGILWEGEKPTAIINQSFFSVGDSNDRFSVIKILQDRVVLKDRIGEFELRLKQ